MRADRRLSARPLNSLEIGRVPVATYIAGDMKQLGMCSSAIGCLILAALLDPFQLGLSDDVAALKSLVQSDVDVLSKVASRSWWKMPMAVISSGLVTGSSGQIE
jgi:hypothetical protein